MNNYMTSNIKNRVFKASKSVKMVIFYMKKISMKNFNDSIKILEILFRIKELNIFLTAAAYRIRAGSCTNDLRELEKFQLLIQKS